MGLKNRLEELAQPLLSIGVVDRFIHDQPFADLIMWCIGSVANLALAVFNGILWVLNPSPWSATLTFYFAALVIMNSLVAACTGSNGKLTWRVVGMVCGTTLVVMAVIVVGIMHLCIIEGHNDALPEFVMIALALITFVNTVVAIVTATRTRKGDLRQQTLLRVSLAGVIGALLMLEMQMFGTYAHLADSQLIVTMESISGVVGALLLLLMGCSLFSKARTA